MTPNHFGWTLLIVTSLTFVYCQEQKPIATLSTQTLYLKTTWDGKAPANDPNVIPVVFDARTKTDTSDVIVEFNASAILLAEDQFLSPEIFGVLFKGENNAILQVEVHKREKSAVTLFNGFDKPLQPKVPLQANVNEKDVKSTVWNATVAIPVDYFPRGTNEWAVYANYTQGPSHAVHVLSLIHTKSPAKEVLPNLLKQEFFTTFDLKADFTKWSPVWQTELGVSPGGEVVNPPTESKPDAIKQENKNNKNEGSLLEQGLTVWILSSAVFCGMLHAFVLSL